MQAVAAVGAHHPVSKQAVRLNDDATAGPCTAVFVGDTFTVGTYLSVDDYSRRIQVDHATAVKSGIAVAAAARAGLRRPGSVVIGKSRPSYRIGG